MFEFQFILLGFIQGITEFLPISSSAHLILVSQLLQWEDQGLFNDIAVHVGTLLSVILYLYKDLKKIIFDFFQIKNFQNPNNSYFALKIVVATIPALIVGFIVYQYFISYFRNILVIAYASIFFGIILYIVDRYSKSDLQWQSINFKQAFIIGLFQTFAFIPGASRAGVTMTGARFLGVRRDSAIIFSMLLSIPIILASVSLSIWDIYALNTVQVNISQSIISSIVSFLTALTSIHLMMKIVKKTNYNIFIIYRIILGITLLAFYV